MTRSKPYPPVAVFGASGHTGNFVVRELVRRDIPPVAVGRRTSRLAERGFAERDIEIREASIEEPHSLDRAFDGAAVVINCAGPFLDTAAAVAAAALRTGSHYLDVTAEQASARATFEHFDRPARDAGLVVIPAMGFYGGLADLLVTAAIGDWEAVDEIDIGIALDSWHPTRGTRLTGQRNTVPRVVISGGRLAPLPRPPAERVWTFPPPFARQPVVEVPFSEVVLIARHIRTSELHTYLCEIALRDLHDPGTPPPGPADDSGRSGQTFLVEAVVANGDRTRRIAARGRDIYAFSAPLVCEAAQRILDGRIRRTGAQAPGVLFDARSCLDALAPFHLTYEISVHSPAAR